MSVRLPPHKHCPHCDEPISESEEYCSEECRAALEGKKTKVSRRNLLFYILAFGALIAIWVLAYVI